MVQNRSHANARTDTTIREAIRDSSDSIRKLAQHYGLNPKTIAKWKARADPNDRPSGPSREDAKPAARTARSASISRRDEALHIAGRVFLKYGYERASMSGIAAELGGSKSALWKLFPSKAVLFEAYLETVVFGVNEMLENALDTAKPVEMALHSYVHRLLSFLYREDALEMHRLVLGASARFHEAGLPPFRAGFAHNDVALVNFLKKHMAAGRLVKEDPLAATHVLESLCNGGAYQRVLLGVQEPDSVDPQREADRITKLFLRLFAAPS